MILFVNIEHESWWSDPERRTGVLAYHLDLKYKFEDISGLPCLLLRYGMLDQERIRSMGVRAIIISGNATDWPEYEENSFDVLFDIVRAAEFPILGICGGHQVIGMAHGAGEKPMRKLRPGEADPTDLSAPGYFKEVGFMPIQVLKDDPIFAGIDGNPNLMALHYKEVDRLPEGFEVLASSAECPFQVIKQFDKPVYGFQLHPEAYCEYPDDMRAGLVSLVYPQGHGQARPYGRTILENFFRIAGIVP